MKRTILLVVVLAVAVWVGMQWLPSEPTATATPLADDMVQLDEPLPGAVVSSPMTVRGRARGNWFFEASFPVVLTDWDGRILAAVPAQAQGEWMTTDWVPFEVVVVFEADTSVSSRGALILKKDNPSGLPENDDSREITVFFK
ncbi:MAG TPA: Gmad2 immunoglobulin-like domain-containing protein [Candidatus Paceibacterota bacterium]|nr:Gmad2 immunoglobulin-like domain-containing protein [Candidatus Paceibacterota bacterium]